MRRGVILCGLFLAMTGAVAFGAPLRSSSSPTGAPPNASSIRLLAGRLLEQPELAQLLRKQAGTHRTPAKGTPGPRVVLLGEHALESTVAHNLVGTVEAFQFQARGSGTAASINVFLAAGDRATALFAGVYSSRDGRPHSLLTSGFLRAPRAAAWNSVAVRAARLQSGRTYWLAVLGKGGAIYFRDRTSGLCNGERSSKRRLRSLPSTWPAGPSSRACFISAYVKRALHSGTSGGGTNVFGTNSPGGAGPTPVSTVGPYFTASTGTTSSCSQGCAVVGQTLGVSNGSWTNSPTGYSYQWKRCTTTSAQPPTTGSCSAISGATRSTYTVQSADVGRSLVPVVTAYNGSTASSPTGLAGMCDTGEMLGMTTQSYGSQVPTSQPAGCSPISAVVGTGTAGELFCTNAVTTCGYADPLNQTVGVPSGVTPSTTGACAAYTRGATISSGTVTINGCEITGQIYVTGGTVTVENSDLPSADESGANAPIEARGGTVIAKYDTVHGLGTTPSGSLAWGIYDCCGSPAATVDHVFFYNGDRILMNLAAASQTPTVTNSFCWSAAQVVFNGSAEHGECIYTQPPSSISVQNTTLLNWRDQTAANYVDDNTGSCCGTVNLANNLLGGGDYTFYGGGPQVNSETYLNNRITRAIYSTAGLYGPGDYNASASGGTGFTQTGNIWDNTGAAAGP